MPHSHLEVERVFAPGDQTPLPDLTRAGPVTRVEPLGEAELDATYYDTPGLALISHGVTLRRREGGVDEGWHLKLPVGVPEARRELHRGLGSATKRPPKQFRDLVDGWARGIEVAPVARIQTLRTTYRLVGPDGGVLAELADDRVTGHPAQLDAEPKRWREWEVELVDGDAELLDIVEAVLAAHDVHRSAVTRKVAHVLGADLAPAPPTPAPRRKEPARLHLQRHLVDEVRAIGILDPSVRTGEAGGVHGMRKSTRRLRSVLATYRPLLDREVTDPLLEELRWLAGSLSQARDDEVVLERLVGALDAEEGPYAAPARRLLDQYAAGRAGQDQANVVAALASDRYRQLREALDALAADPPWTEDAERPAKEVLPPRLAKEWRRVQARREEAEDPHEVRKAVKRLRYALELLEPAWGKDAQRARRVARRLSDVLGEGQDSVVARDWLEALAAEAARAGVPSYSFGRLHAREQQRERDALTEAEPLWHDLGRALKKW